jgi:hypothetical protein
LRVTPLIGGSHNLIGAFPGLFHGVRAKWADFDPSLYPADPHLGHEHLLAGWIDPEAEARG